MIGCKLIKNGYFSALPGCGKVMTKAMKIRKTTMDEDNMEVMP